MPLRDPIITCETCGCVVLFSEAVERGWGTLRGAVQCSRECAETLYTRDFVARHYVPGTLEQPAAVTASEERAP